MLVVLKAHVNFLTANQNNHRIFFKKNKNTKIFFCSQYNNQFDNYDKFEGRDAGNFYPKNILYPENAKKMSVLSKS